MEDDLFGVGEEEQRCEEEQGHQGQHWKGRGSPPGKGATGDQAEDEGPAAETHHVGVADGHVAVEGHCRYYEGRGDPTDGSEQVVQLTHRGAEYPKADDAVLKKAGMTGERRMTRMAGGRERLIRKSQKQRAPT